MHGIEVLSAPTRPALGRSNCTGRSWEATRFHAMGAECSVLVVDGPLGLAKFAECEVARCESHWSRFREDSELRNLNARAGSGFVSLTRDTFAVIERAVELWYATNGWFDPTVLDALIAAGYDATFEQIRRRRIFARPRPPEATAGCAGIELDRTRQAVRLPRNVHLDLGGVGKGFAADLVAERVVDRGARGVCVELGGDIRVLGEAPDGDAWAIEVEDPFDERRVLLSSMLDDDAIVTSTRLFRRWCTAEGEAHHLIDPTTGESARTGVAAVITRARDAAGAEAVAKAALVAGFDRGAQIVSRTGSESWFVMDDRRVVVVDREGRTSC
jgi:thiamine biosynthesis lipoprotein